MKTFELNITGGDDVALDVAITRDGVPLDLTGATLWFTMKTSADLDDNHATVQLTIGDGITIVDAEAGTASVLLSRTITNDLVVGTTYLTDLQVKDAAGLVSTAASGKVRVRQQITRAEA